MDVSIELREELKRQYEEFIDIVDPPEDRYIKDGEELLAKIRSTGRYLVDPEREEFAQMARDIGERLFELTNEYLPIRLETLEVFVDLESPYGTMRPDSKFYIEREADNLCWESLSKSRATTLALQGSRQTGKSSLIHRMKQRAGQKLDKQTIFVDFQFFPKEYFTDEDKFLREFCREINRSLGLSKKIIEEHWDEDGTPISNCSTYLEDYVISHFNTPFILALDEVDRMFTSSFRSNFFGMLRVWHNKRAASDNFAKMTLLLSSSTEPHLFIDSIHQSPFNVAELVRLQDFTGAEVDKLHRLHGQPFHKDQLSKLQKLLNGHPFLTRVAFYQLAADRITFEALLEQAINDDGPFGEHLNRYYRVISEQSEFEQAIIRICLDQVQPKEQERVLYQLKGLGLIKEIKGRVTFRNELYARYFKERFNAGRS